MFQFSSFKFLITIHIITIHITAISKPNPRQLLYPGSWHGPSTPGSSYVLLHHVMGGIGEREGAWGYVEGGMGSVSNAIARSALAAGATIKTDAVSVFIYESVVI